MESQRANGAHSTANSKLLPVVKLLLIGIANLPLLRAAPTRFSVSVEEDGAMAPDNPTLWIYLAVAVGLVLLGGVFAGLTIALMGQDEIYLQVIRTSGEGKEKTHAAKVLRLLKRGKHWVLVTLLLGNVITNETLPIVLDRSLGGGWPAVLGSTVLIVIFGEIIPQSICVRYGLPIGAYLSPLVLILMYLLAPIAWPTAKLLDRLLGEDHGTTYKKAGLKTLVTLHKTLGSAGEQLNSDEVTIISAVLDLKDKPVGSIMTPMGDTFTMSADTVLDENTMDIILSAGYSRIPIYSPEKPQNFVGMLLVKILITYDPEDNKRVRDFALATLPETRPETSCLDIVNFFQEGKSHMVLVSEYPGEDYGALGVLTLEDVIEELIGEEIIDESDVFVDVHKAIRRITPAPKSRVPKGEVITDTENKAGDGEENLIDLDQNGQAPSKAIRRVATSEASAKGELKPKPGMSDLGSSPKGRNPIRRSSSVTTPSDHEAISKRTNSSDMREHFKHLGPSNLASRPRQTRYNTVKIKPGGGPLYEAMAKNNESFETPRTLSLSTAPQGGVGEGLLGSAGKDAKDGVLALQAGYGSMDRTPPKTPRSPETINKSTQASTDEGAASNSTRLGRGNSNSGELMSQGRPESAHSHSTVGSTRSRNGREPRSPRAIRGTARSGSITENIIDAGGVRKVVLETTSSSDDVQDGTNGPEGGQLDEGGEARKTDDEPAQDAGSKSGKKKRRRKRRKGGNSEDTPLLERDEE